MSEISEVTGVDLKVSGDDVLVIATGFVPTSGWSHPGLAQLMYYVPPADGIQEFGFYAIPPSGMVLQVLLPVTAWAEFQKPSWCKGVRVSANGASVEVPLLSVAAAGAPTFTRVPYAAIASRWSTVLANFDDSIQPTGNSKIEWEGSPIPIPVPHFEMKKLVHELVLTVTGPDENKIKQCFQEAAAAGLIATIIATYFTGGAALSAALSTFTAQLKGCLGNSFAVRVDNRSHWVTWWT